MELQDELKVPPSKKQRQKIIDYVGDDDTRIKKLVDLFLAGPYRISQPASHILACVFENHPGKVRPHLNLLLKASQNPSTHPSKCNAHFAVYRTARESARPHQ